MLKYRRCLSQDKCKLKAKDPMTGAEDKRCLLSNGKCEHQGCLMIMPDKAGEDNGRLILDALDGKFNQ